MQVLFIIVLIVFSLACILIWSWLFNTVYNPWLYSAFLEYKNKDEEHQPTCDGVEVEEKKDEL